MAQEQPADDGRRIFLAWDARARARDVEGLLALYAPDATLESPLIPAILEDQQTGVLHGHAELRRLLTEGRRRLPSALVRWYRTGEYLWDGKTLVWEYPREAPDGDQVDITEVMDIGDGKIQRHRIYWGWFGLKLLQEAWSAKQT